VKCFGYEPAAFDFIERIADMPRVEDVMDHMQTVLGRYGFDRLLVSGLPEQELSRTILAVRWPAEFMDMYNERDWIRVDPVVRQTRKSAWPFKWDAGIQTEEADPAATELMARAADFGLVEGFVVPIHRPDTLPSIVAMSGSKVDLPAEAVPSIHLMALYAFDRIRRQCGSAKDRPMRLTPREREVLSWAARGKTAWEIGELLKITKRTVDEHVKTCCRKLQAANRTQAVASAIRDRLIDVG
jgi:LuxR family transcriptional regulator, quorum-sensing system regulator BjaR1